MRRDAGDQMNYFLEVDREAHLIIFSDIQEKA